MTSYNRKEVNYTDIYHNYYSDISLGAGVGADTLSEQQVHRYSVDTPRYSVDAPLYTPASVYSPPLESSNRRYRGIASSTLRQPLQSKLSNFKKWASKTFQKTFRDSSMNLNSKHSASSSSLPVAPLAKQNHNHQQHRRTVSVRPLPAIPVTKADAGVPRSETVPRHRRRATNGARDLPVELKRADEHKELMDKFSKIQQDIQADLQGLFNLLGLRAVTAGSDAASQAIDFKVEDLNAKFAALKDIAGQVQGAVRPVSMDVAVQKPSSPAAAAADEEQTQVGVSSSRNSSTSSMEKLKELTNRLVTLTAPRGAVAA